MKGLYYWKYCKWCARRGYIQPSIEQQSRGPSWRTSPHAHRSQIQSEACADVCYWFSCRVSFVVVGLLDLVMLVALCSESSQLLAWTHSYRRCFCFHSDSVIVRNISIMAVCHILLVETVAVWMSIKFFFFVIVESIEYLCEICVLEICVNYFGAKHKFKTHTKFCSFWKHRRILNIHMYLLQV